MKRKMVSRKVIDGNDMKNVNFIDYDNEDITPVDLDSYEVGKVYTYQYMVIEVEEEEKD